MNSAHHRIVIPGNAAKTIFARGFCLDLPAANAAFMNYPKSFTKLQLALLLPSVAVVLLYCLNALYSNPSGDDFLYADTYIKLGFSGSQIHWYTDWNGRYFSTIFLTWLNPLSYHRYDLYKVVNILLLLSLFFSLFYTALSFARRAGIKESFIIALLFMIFFSVNLTQMESGIYWIACSYVYIPGIVGFCAYLLLYFSAALPIKWRSTLLILLAFIIIGTNELSMMSLLCFHGLKISYDWLFDKKLNKNDLLLLCFSLLFSSAVFLCPGNQVRKECFSTYAEPGNLMLSLKLAAMAFYKFFREKYFSIFIYVLLFVLFTAKSNKLNNKVPAKVLFLVFALLAYIFLMNFASSYSTGLMIYGRTTNVIYFHFCLLLSLFLWILRPHIPVPSFNLSSPYVGVFGFLLMVAVVLKSATIGHLLHDYTSGNAQKFSEECTDRFRKMEAAALHGKPAFVSPHRFRPTSLYLFDYDTLNDYNVRCCERYYGIDVQIK